MVTIDRMYGGTALAKVLHYYGQDTDADKIVCPFHDDLNPSMVVNYNEGKCYCFGCNKSYDPLAFVKQAEGIDDDLKACMKLAHVLKSPKVKRIKAHSVKVSRTDNKQMMVEASDYFYCLKKVDWFKEDSDTLNYMLNRGFDCATLNKCDARYTYNPSYPIIFPILDNGEFKGWDCRTTNPQIAKKRKYLYNEGFSRASTLCGDYKMGKVLVICEGYMDFMKFKQFGIKYVVALLGCKASAEQIQKLKDAGITRIVSALDNDNPGRQGTDFLKSFFDVVPFAYPMGVNDPGEMNDQQFKQAFKRTKAILGRKKQNELSRRNQKSGEKIRHKQK